MIIMTGMMMAMTMMMMTIMIMKMATTMLMTMTMKMIKMNGDEGHDDDVDDNYYCCYPYGYDDAEMTLHVQLPGLTLPWKRVKKMNNETIL